ncbi:hypothetical protein [Algibacillus agarilyticus]|uniref:hypothetical protein n=1 Tax=Algibacillus agarilyticus TaxID=2234133 RepID=UPI000DD02EFB|nr:hypothetical protein [Algibacillus agarilyticus]
MLLSDRHHVITQDELEGLVNIASTYPYTHITWVNEQITEIGIIKENRFQRIQDADISKLIDFAKNQNRQGLELYKSEQGNWHFPLFNQTIKTNNAVVKISTQYIFNNQTHTTLKNCGSIEYSKVADGECMVAIFDKWVLHKYWFTTAFKNGI